MVRLCLERDADIDLVTTGGEAPSDLAGGFGHITVAKWLERIQKHGWVKYLSEPRCALAVLRELAARGRARRARELSGKELVLDFLFPGDQAPTQANKPRLPDDLFPLIARYFWAAACRPAS